MDSGIASNLAYFYTVWSDQGVAAGDEPRGDSRAFLSVQEARRTAFAASATKGATPHHIVTDAKPRPLTAFPSLVGAERRRTLWPTAVPVW